MKVEAVRSSETILPFYQATRRHIPEGSNPVVRHRKNKNVTNSQHSSNKMNTIVLQMFILNTCVLFVGYCELVSDNARNEKYTA